jgi:hypothetical protein
MRGALVAIVLIVAVACQPKRKAEEESSADAVWKHVEELAAPLSKPGPPNLLDEARKIPRSHNWATDKSYPELSGAVLLLRQWQLDEGGIRSTRGLSSNAVEYRDLLRPIVKTTTDPAVLTLVDTVGRRFLEQGTSLVDASVGVMIMREVAVRTRALKLPHTLDTALWSKGAVRMIAAEAVAIQTARLDPNRPKPAPESVLDADANLAALTAVLKDTTLNTDWEALLVKLRAAPVTRPSAKRLVDDIIEMIEADRKLAADLRR